MRYHEIAESFDHPQLYTWIEKTWHESDAEFHANGHPYQVRFRHQDTLDNDIDLYNVNFYAIVDGQQNVDVIGKTGAAFSVFATVIAIISEFLITIQPGSAIGFTADGLSRIRLYSVLMNKLSNRLPEGYTVSKHGGTTRAVFYAFPKQLGEGQS